jgi:Mn2+/Fe2+ NRAMP family transporter
MTATTHPHEKNSENVKRSNLLKRSLAILGPGLITGAADDDPSGISTYSVAGAAYGYATLWIALLTFPLMVAIQLMCARLGMVTGHGLASAVRIHFPRWVLWGSCSILVVANILNIGADLGGMAEATELITRIRARSGFRSTRSSSLGFLFWASYTRIAKIFKWLTSYCWRTCWLRSLPTLIEARSGGDLRAPSRVVPRIFGSPHGHPGHHDLSLSFLWQAAEEVEEERWGGSHNWPEQGRDHQGVKNRRADTIAGMFFSNFIMYFIILTTAPLCMRTGKPTSPPPGKPPALRPLAGNGAYFLFTLGLIGTGLLGVLVLVGSCAYAVTEAAVWRGSMSDKPNRARKFYAVMGIAMTLGLVLNYLGFNAVKMLFWSAVINGILAPPLILLVILLTCSHKVMGNRVNPAPLRYLGWATFLVMSAAAAGMLIAS